MGKGYNLSPLPQLFDPFAQEHLLRICTEEIRNSLWYILLKSVEEMATLADFFVQAQMSNECKPQKEGPKPSVKGDPILPMGRRRG